MRPWSIVAAVLAALAILFLVFYDSDERDASGRGREGTDERAAQQLVGLPAAIGAEQSITIVLEREELPGDTAGLIGEVRDLLATAEGQPPDQAKATLEQGLDRLDAAIEQVEEVADDTSNDVAKSSLLRLRRTLESIRDEVEDRVDQL